MIPGFMDGRFVFVHVIADATYIQNRDARMRRISFRCFRRRPASQGRHEFSNRCCCRSQEVHTSQQSTLASILDSSRSGYEPLPRIKVILADLNRYTSRVHLPLTTVPAKTVFRRVVSRMLNAAMATEPTGPTTRSHLTPTGLRKIEPYWYPYTTMAKGRWLGREMLEVVSTEFRDRSIDYYVSPSNFCPKYPTNNTYVPHPEIRSRVWGDHYQRRDCQTRYHYPKRRPNRVRSFLRHDISYDAELLA